MVYPIHNLYSFIIFKFCIISKTDDFCNTLIDYSCKNGKVNIIVGKGSRKEELVCDKAGQNISVALKDGEFLHLGAIICPGCIEMCGEVNCLLDNSFNDREGRKEDDDEDNESRDPLLERLEKKAKEKSESVTTSLNSTKTSKSIFRKEMPDSFNSTRTSKSISRKEIPDSKVGVKDELTCDGVGGGGFFDQFFDYFD